MKPSKGREDIYQQVLDLHATNRWGARNIARTLVVPLRTVSRWIAGSPIKSHYGGNFTPKVIPNLHPSPELAYLLGATLGDGTVGYCRANRAWRITLRATDLEFVQEYARCLTHILGPEYSLMKKTRDNPRWKPIWRVDAQSRLFAKYLRQPLDAFRPLLQAYPEPFLRGLFDSEGSAYKRTWEGRPYWGIAFVNTQIDLIDLVDETLKGLDILGHRYINYRKSVPHLKKLYMWVCQTRDNLRRFRDRVGFTISRKQEVLISLPS